MQQACVVDWLAVFAGASECYPHHHSDGDSATAKQHGPSALGSQQHCQLGVSSPPRPALPRPALPCPALPCPALPCPALPCPALPCPALPCPALPCPALPCPALPSSCPALPCPARDFGSAMCHKTIAATAQGSHVKSCKACEDMRIIVLNMPDHMSLTVACFGYRTPHHVMRPSL